MADRFQAVFSRIWQDEKFIKLTSDGKFLFLYCLTSPHSNAIGIYVLPRAYMAEDMGWDLERLREPFRELMAQGLIFYDENIKLVCIKNHLKYNAIDNPNQTKAAVKLLNELPRSALYQELIKQLDKPFHEPLREGLRERLPEGFGKPEPEPEPEPETETIKHHAPNEPEKKVRSKQKMIEDINFNFASGEWEGINGEHRGIWAKAFPAVNADIQIAQAAAWLMANPAKRKQNYFRFLTNWLRRSQERGGDLKSRKPEEEDWIKRWSKKSSAG